MKTTIIYKGTLNGIHGLWCGFCPEDVIVEEEITVYHPDAGKIFKKDSEYFDSLVLHGNESIEDYKEVEKPADTEEQIDANEHNS